MMKKILVSMIALSLMAFASVAFADCGADHGAAAAVSAATCPKCGEIAGSEKCCAPGAELCAGCGLHKGSPGCMAKCAPKATEPQTEHPQ
jgi:hypothetical protein